MSIRTDHNSTDASYAGAVRKDLETLKQTAVEAARLDAVDTTYRPTSAEAAALYDSLHPVEQSAANLGVEPGALRPIVRRTPAMPNTLLSPAPKLTPFSLLVRAS